MSERAEILKSNRNMNVVNGLPKSKIGFLVGLITRNVNVLSNFVHKWGRP